MRKPNFESWGKDDDMEKLDIDFGSVEGDIDLGPIEDQSLTYSVR